MAENELNKLYIYPHITHGDYRMEDGGQSKIVTFSDDNKDGIFLRLHSWNEKGNHKAFDMLLDAGIKKITIEY